MRAMLAQALVVSFLVSFGVLLVLLSRFARSVLDAPNERSLHVRPVARTGGIAILAGAGAALALGASTLWLQGLLAVVLAAVSFADDVRGLPAPVRLAAHGAAAACLAWYVLGPMNYAALALLVLAVVWMTNLFNFMDGADGVAGGMALIGFGAYAVAAQGEGHAPLALACASLAASALAFLIFNSHPARIFMGDIGSIPLGFLAGALGLTGWREDLWPLWFPLLVFAPFVGDASLTLLKRLARGERIWRAHRDHYYQRMVLMGLGHRGTALLGYAAMALCAGAALYARDKSAPVQAALFGGSSLALGAAGAWIDARWRRFSRDAQGAA